MRSCYFMLNQKNRIKKKFHLQNEFMQPKTRLLLLVFAIMMIVLFACKTERPGKIKNRLVGDNFINTFTGLGRKTWITTEAGLSIVSGEKMSFTSKPVVNDILYVSSNYSTHKESQSAVGGILKADFNWVFTPYLGLGVGAFAAVNSIQSPVGGEIKLIAGWLNTKGKK